MLKVPLNTSQLTKQLTITGADVALWLTNGTLTPSKPGFQILVASGQNCCWAPDRSQFRHRPLREAVKGP